jgi:hypothetical protein
MSSVILSAFLKFPAEAAIIGRLIAGYGELEFGFALCLGRAIGDQNAAAKTLFRLRGEDSRLQVADALMRRRYSDQNLTDAYNTAIGAMRHCKAIRNQYAHCHWLETTEGLFFTDFDKPAKSSQNVLMLSFNHIDEALLKSQEAYFVQTSVWLSYLFDEHKRREQKLSTAKRAIPTTLAKPPLHNPRELHPLPQETREAIIL